MAQVPYNPIPEAQPASPNARLGDAPVIPEAFGINIGQAVTGFGNELASRALKIQEDKNTNAADAATVEFMKQSGAEHAKFAAMEGKERDDYYQQHVDNLEKIRQRVGETLT